MIPFAIFPQFPSEYYARLEGCQVEGGQVNRTEVHFGYMSQFENVADFCLDKTMRKVMLFMIVCNGFIAKA